jgi:hypothetical protein
MYSNHSQTMGKILTSLTIINRADQWAVSRGLLTQDQVRSVNLENVLVDTGATTLCLPSQIISQLGLELLKEVEFSKMLKSCSVVVKGRLNV